MDDAEELADQLAAARQETEAVRQKLHNAIRKGKAIQSEKEQLAERLRALEAERCGQRQGPGAAPTCLPSPPTQSALRRFAASVPAIRAPTQPFSVLPSCCREAGAADGQQEHGQLRPDLALLEDALAERSAQLEEAQAQLSQATSAATAAGGLKGVPARHKQPTFPWLLSLSSADWLSSWPA